MKTTTLTICVVLLVFSRLNNGSQIDPNEFVPTNQWQIVREGQILPAGLHVRLNLETGLREAKLLDSDEQSSTSHSIISIPSATNQEEMSRKNLEQAFAQLDLTKDDVLTDNSHQEEIRRKFRSYDELKKDFEALNVKVETDQEIVRRLIEQLNEKTNIEDRKTILIDLEYYLHQYDNAIFFSDVNGLNLLMNWLNTTDTDVEIRHLVSLALAAAFQGNPTVQLKGLHLGLIQSLLRLIVVETNDELKLRLLYPLSTLLRNFPQAQIQFVEYGGPESMINLLDSNRKLANRAVTLMNDLIVEKSQADENKRQAYENVHIDKQLVERGWCARLSSRLKSIEIDEFDSIEKIVSAFLSVTNVCSEEIHFFRQTFERLYEIYNKRHLSDDSIYGELLNNLQLILNYHRQRSTDDL